MGYDTEIRVHTKVDTSQMQKLQIQIDKATNKVATLSAKYDEIKNKKIPTDNFNNLEIKLKSAQNELEKLIAEENKLANAGLAIGAPWDNVIAKEADAQLKIENIQAEMQKLVEGGKAFTLGGDKDEINKAVSDLSMAKSELKALVTRQDELNYSQKKSKSNLSGITEEFKKIKDVSKKLFGLLSPKVQKTSGMLSTLASRFKGIALSLLIFNWVTRGFNSMVSGMKVGFKNLIKYSDSYAKSVADLKNANAQLQNSFAAAFAPIVQMIIPQLITFINYVTKAMNTIAQFVAVLSGKSSWIKATEVQGDYADSLNGTASAAKKAMGALASFDSLEVLNKKESSGGGSNTGGGFEEVPIEPTQAVNLAKRLKELIAADDWYGVGVLIGEKINGLLENINWDSIQSQSVEIARNIANFLNGGLETTDWILVGETIAEGLNTGLLFVNSFVTTFHWESLGTAIYSGVNGFLSTFNFELAAETISNISHGLFTTLQTAIEGVKWDDLGVKIARFIKELEWKEFFEDVGITVMDAFVASVKLAGGLLLGDTDLYEYFETGINDISARLNALKGKYDTGDTSVDGVAVSKLEDALSKYSEIYSAKEKNNKLSEKDIENGEKVNALLEKEGDITNLNLADIEKFTDELLFASSETDKFYSEAGENFKDAFNGEDVGKNLGLGVVNGIKGVGEDIKGLFALMFNSVNEAGVDVDFTALFETLKEKLVGGWNSIDGWWKEHAPLAFLPAWFSENVMPWFSAEKWNTLGQGILDGISTKWIEFCDWWNQSALGVWWEESVAPWFTSEKWIELAQGIVDGVSTKWDELVEWWDTNIVAWWEEYVAPWFTVEQWQKLGDNMKKGIYNGFCGIVSKVVDVMNGIISACENMINFIIDKINELLNGANLLAQKAHIDINFGQLSPIKFDRVEMPKIPALANGAVLRGGNPMLAILNDQPAGQTNIEAPAELIKQMTREGIAESGLLRTASGSGEVQLIMEGQVVGKILLPHLLNEWNRAGYNISVLE